MHMHIPLPPVFPVSSSLSVPLPDRSCLALPPATPLCPFLMTGSDLTWAGSGNALPSLSCTFPYQPDRSTDRRTAAHAFAGPLPALNKYILARRAVPLPKYLRGLFLLPPPLASRRIGAPSSPAHFPMPASAPTHTHAHTLSLFKVALSTSFGRCPSTVDIGPRQHRKSHR